MDPDGLATAVSVWLPVCVVCFCVYMKKGSGGQNENRSFMAKSWEEQICPSASFPVCMSLWLTKKEVHAKAQLSQSPFVSISIFVYVLWLSVPLMIGVQSSGG